jgi:hypothetical protein
MLHDLISEGIVSQIKLPALPDFLVASDDLLMGHFPEAVVVGLLRSYIRPEKRQAALDMIATSYLRPPTLIETFLNKVEAQRPLYSSLISSFKGRLRGATQVAVNTGPHI